MLDIFKRPIFIVIVLVAIVVAMIWSLFTKTAEQKKIRENEAKSTVSAIDLTTIDADDFDEVVVKELSSANEKALAANPSYRLAAVEINLPSLLVNSGETRYIFSDEASADNWTITFDQKTGSFLRARIPKDDYLGGLPTMNTNLWKFNFVTAIQIFEKSGGLEWRNSNGFSNAKLTLKHGGKSNWLLWYVEYKSGDATFSKVIDANSGKLIEE